MSKTLNAIQNALRGAEYDALLITTPQNRFYATGFMSSDGVAVVTPDAALFATDFRYFETAESEIEGYELVMATYEHLYPDIINEFCAKHGVETLGFESGGVNYDDYLDYSEELDARLIPSNGEIEKLRLVKSDWELERMEKAQRIAEKALEQVLPVICEGVAERDIAAEIDYRMRKGGASGNSFDTICVSGENGSHCHGVPGGRKLRPGDFITMDFGCIYDGYCSDMTRTVALGYATDEMKYIYGVVLEAQKKALAAARADIISADLHNVAADIIAEAGYGKYFGHSLGHSLGVEVHDGVGADPTSDDVLPEGMVVTIEPGIYIPGKFGVRIEDFVVLEREGCRNFTKAPKELMIL